MGKKQFISILDRYLKNQATAEQQNILYAYYHLFMADADVLLLLKDEEKERLKLQIKAEINTKIDGVREMKIDGLRGMKIDDAMDARIDEVIAAEPNLATLLLWKRIAQAVAAVTLITLGAWFYRDVILSLSKDNPDITISKGNDISPGKNTASLTLANGKIINLSDAKTGVVIDASKISYNDGSNIDSRVIDRSHPGEDEDLSSAIKTLTITTPRGGTYQITLPDGTKAWLNASSSLTYTAPLKTIGGQRKVGLMGEAYFEVFKNKSQPFVVTSKKMELTVLGTHFNISAYEDENSTKATLLEGSVRVLPVAGNAGTVLKPAEQAVLSGSNKLAVIKTNPEDAIAWKNGLFNFKSEDMGSIMRKVARWYNIEAVFTDRSDVIIVSGEVPRFANLSSLLSKLQKTGLVSFKIKGRKVYISKY